MKTSLVKLSRSWWQLAGGCAAMLSALCLSGCVTSEQNSPHRDHPEVAVPEGHQEVFRLHAEGVQIYSWNGTNWAFHAPEAKLYDKHKKVVGNHSAGPTWQSVDGSKVVGKVVTNAPAYDSNAIPHLLLKSVSASGPGVFANITYIQRVDTMGGRAPQVPGSSLGQEARVNYTARYVFYRAAK